MPKVLYSCLDGYDMRNQFYDSVMYFIHTHTHTYIYIYICVCMCVCVCVCACVCNKSRILCSLHILRVYVYSILIYYLYARGLCKAHDRYRIKVLNFQLFNL